MQSRKKVVIIAQRYGITPAIFGGAVESLIGSLAENNEIHHAIDLTIIQSYNAKARELTKKFKDTKFVFLRDSILGKLDFRIFGQRKNEEFMKGHIFSEYIYKSYRYIKKNIPDVDVIIFEEDSQIIGYKKFQRQFPGKVAYHSHLHEKPKKNIYYDYVITVSEFCRREWLDLLPESKVLVLRNGVNLSRFKKRLSQDEKTQLRASLGITTDDFIVLYCGRLIPIKGVLELAMAITEIPEKNIRLLCVGSSGFSGGGETAYTEHIHALALKNTGRIIFTGYVNNEELYKYHQISDLQVIPSLCEDAAPLVPIEGMCSGLPLIVTDSGGMIEYIDDACALVVSRDDIVKNLTKAIMRAKADDAWRRKASREGSLRAEKFSEEAFYRNFVSLIETIASK